MDIQKKSGERLDVVNDNLSLISHTEGLTLGTDTLLLASYIRGKSGAKAMELGAGTGILSLLAVTRNKVGCVTALEVQEKYALLARRNVELNRLGDRIRVEHTDLRRYVWKDGEAGSYDVCFTNPPYMPTNVGARNASEDNYIARHEVHGDIYDFCATAAKALKYGGRFYAVYRADRLCDLFSAMRENRLEPKRLTLIHADSHASPSIVLTEGIRGGKPSLTVTRPLILYKDDGHTVETEDIKRVYETGNLFTEEKI